MMDVASYLLSDALPPIERRPQSFMNASSSLPRDARAIVATRGAAWRFERGTFRFLNPPALPSLGEGNLFLSIAARDPESVAGRVLGALSGEGRVSATTLAHARVAAGRMARAVGMTIGDWGMSADPWIGMLPRELKGVSSEGLLEKWEAFSLLTVVRRPHHDGALNRWLTAPTIALSIVYWMHKDSPHFSWHHGFVSTLWPEIVSAAKGGISKSIGQWLPPQAHPSRGVLLAQRRGMGLVHTARLRSPIPRR